MSDTTFSAGTVIASTWLNDVNRKVYREYITINDFSPAMDGATDDLVPLTNFINSANANPGVPHLIFPGIYACSGTLPNINVSGVWIEGAGMSAHDVGSRFSGPVIKKIGSAGGIMLTIAPTEGASAQRLSNVRFRNIAFDCNSLAATGVTVKSVWNSEIIIGCAEATNIGAIFGVSDPLGENACLQKCIIKYESYQVFSRSGVGFVFSGSPTANPSMVNELYMDGVHSDAPFGIVQNSDNNDWRLLRSYCIPGGTATESVSLLGGTVEPESSRLERFHVVSGNKPVHVYGTGTYASASYGHQFFCLDVGNGTPDPTIDAGASASYRRDQTPFGDTPWTSYTPTITSSSGTITTSSATGSYLKRGRLVFVRAQITITTNGTGAGLLNFSLPTVTNSSIGAIFHGVERAVTGKSVTGWVDGGGVSTVACRFYDGTYPGGDGRTITITGFYENA